MYRYVRKNMEKDTTIGIIPSSIVCCMGNWNEEEITAWFRFQSSKRNRFIFKNVYGVGV